ISPEITLPFLVTECEEIASITGGSGPSGGSDLLPGSVVQLPPQLPSTSLAKPLNEAGASPPESEFSFHHCAPQNSTWVPTVAFSSPITKFSAAPAGAASALAAPTIAAASAMPRAKRERDDFLPCILLNPLSIGEQGSATARPRAIERSATSFWTQRAILSGRPDAPRGCGVRDPRLDVHANIRSHGTTALETGGGAREGPGAGRPAPRGRARRGTARRPRQADRAGDRSPLPAADRGGEPRRVRRLRAALARALGRRDGHGDDRAGSRGGRRARGPAGRAADARVDHRGAVEHGTGRRSMPASAASYRDWPCAGGTPTRRAPKN